MCKRAVVPLVSGLVFAGPLTDSNRQRFTAATRARPTSIKTGTRRAGPQIDELRALTR